MGKGGMGEERLIGMEMDEVKFGGIGVVMLEEIYEN